MNEKEVILRTDGVTGVAIITLNRPKAFNTLDAKMAKQLCNVTALVAGDATIRAVIIVGAGDNFMAGGDIRTFHESLEDSPGQRRAQLEWLMGQIHEAITNIREMDKPVIASVRGAVAGFGFSLMSACDLAIATDTAYFTLAYRHIGTSPDGGSTYALPRLVGFKQAMEIALLGERFDAERALQLGLINRIVKPRELATATHAMARDLASGPAIALKHTKHLMRESLDRNLADQLRAEQDSFVSCAMTKDFARGVRGFVAKQKPEFLGN
jgi:2-(1,2-epoxy-1,2-dihydrophenyl)acetyl-CoA isomerase